MIACKYFEGRMIPISFNNCEDFSNLPRDCFFICIIVDGYVVLIVDGERCYISKNTLLCFEPGRSITCISSYRLVAYSISFEPSFMNANLSYQLICSKNYPYLCREQNYPDFSLFLNHNLIYNGIMPLNEISTKESCDFILKIINQIYIQPDKFWSCRARAFMFSLIQQMQFLCEQFMENGHSYTQLIIDVIAFINRELGSTITIERLCKEFHINRNSLCKRFREEVGKSIIQFIIDRRIEMAKYLLGFTELSVDEIAKSNGFLEQTYFTKVFKNKVGISPLGYRKETKRKRIK